MQRRLEHAGICIMATSSLEAIHASMLASTPHPHTIFMVASKLATMQMECDETARRKMPCDDCRAPQSRGALQGDTINGPSCMVPIEWSPFVHMFGNLCHHDGQLCPVVGPHMPVCTCALLDTVALAPAQTPRAAHSNMQGPHVQISNRSEQLRQP